MTTAESIALKITAALTVLGIANWIYQGGW